CAGPQHFCPSQGKGKEYGVARRDVSVGNTYPCPVGRHLNRLIGQRRSAEEREAQHDHTMLTCAKHCGNPRCGLQFCTMALSVADRQGMTIETVPNCERQRGSGIQPAGQQHNGVVQLTPPALRAIRYLTLASRPFALSAASLDGYFAMSSSRVLRAAGVSPRLFSAVPIISRASGDLVLSG